MSVTPLACAGDDAATSSATETSAATTATGEASSSSEASATETSASTGGATEATSDTTTDTATTRGATEGTSETETETETGGPASCAIRVRPDGDDALLGLTWLDAKATIGAALDAAEASPLDCAVWVAAGTYTPTDDDDRAASFTMRDNIWVYGGFAGDELALDQRDWAANETVLSGDLGVQGDFSDNSVHVVVAADNVRLDGFTVRGGFSDGVGDERNGAGIWGFNVGFTLANAIVEQNRSGDGLDHEAGATGGPGGDGVGMFQRGGSLRVDNVIFRGNVGGRGGVGMSNGGTGGSGAGLKVAQVGALEIRDSAFIDNRTGDGGDGGAIAGAGGSAAGLFIDAFDSDVTIAGCRFEGNATGLNGAIGEFKDQRGTSGGLFFSDGGLSRSLTVINSEFVGNAALNGGGAGIFVVGSDELRVLVANTIFRDNVGQASAAALQVTTDGRGDLLVVNSTFAGNTSPLGSAIAFSATPNQGAGVYQVLNSVFWDNPTEFWGPIYAVASAMDPVELLVDRSDVEGGCVEDMFNSLVCGADNLDADPLFAAADDLRPQPASPVRDAGDVQALPPDLADLDDDGDVDEALPVDLDGLARVAGAAVDLGAYELP
ncbi:MAG: hypothetical protein R3A79_15610 [Nannocystaceae bacterium]